MSGYAICSKSARIAARAWPAQLSRSRRKPYLNVQNEGPCGVVGRLGPTLTSVLYTGLQSGHTVAPMLDTRAANSVGNR